MAVTDVIEQACGALRGYLERGLVDDLPVDYPLQIKMITVKHAKMLTIELKDLE